MRVAALLRGLVLGAALAGAAPAIAVTPDEILPDPQLEARARSLSHELRCMVCQNQSIDDSDAPLAHDLRVLVRERLQAGDSDDKVLEFLTARYGEFVLLKPRFGIGTAVLWLTPVAVLLAGMAGLIVLARRRRHNFAVGTEPELSASEAQRLQQLREQQ